MQSQMAREMNSRPTVTNTKNAVAMAATITAEPQLTVAGPSPGACGDAMAGILADPTAAHQSPGRAPVRGGHTSPARASAAHDLALVEAMVRAVESGRDSWSGLLAADPGHWSLCRRPPGG